MTHEGRGIGAQSCKPLIGVDELAARIDEPDLRIVDCRFDLTDPAAGRALYVSGHIPGAVYADLDKDLAAPVGPGTGRHPLPHAEVLARTFGRLGIGDSTRVVVYDDCSGALAARAWWMLRWLGHERSQLLEGGIARWRARGNALEQGEVAVGPREFTAMPRDDKVLRTEDILDAASSAANLCLIDARDAARFRGEAEPIDPVAGHIPGAVNLPYQVAQNSDGIWKGHGELLQIWAAVRGEEPLTACSVMCGSGVTACHLILTAVLAGLPEPRLYVGSWSEWITDPDRPVATG